MSAHQNRTEAQSLFAIARRILAGEAEAPPPPVDPIDIRAGINRALRTLRPQISHVDAQRHAAARGISIVEGTLVAIDSIDASLSEALDLTVHALATGDEAMRGLLSDRYLELINRIDTVAAGATFDGTNLINNGRDQVEIMTHGGGRPRQAIGHIRLFAGENGLGLSPAREGFQNDAEIERIAAELTRARARVIKAADTLLNQASMLAPMLQGVAGTAAA